MSPDSGTSVMRYISGESRGWPAYVVVGHEWANNGLLVHDLG